MNPLQPAELRLLQDADLLPAKHQLLSKIERELLHTYEALRELHEKRGLLGEALFHRNGKISKGDNYQLQAYRVLDYPRIFDKKDQFAFRTMILWGHEISFHLILSGTYLEQFRDLIRQFEWEEGFWLAAHDTPWTWEQAADHWLPISELRAAEWETYFNTRAFLKISTFRPLTHLKDLPTQTIQIWSRLLQAMGWSSSDPRPSENQAE
ncbi:MAG: hypothetical protein AAF399_20035 [Bacteroidota bacterium]